MALILRNILSLFGIVEEGLYWREHVEWQVITVNIKWHAYINEQTAGVVFRYR